MCVARAHRVLVCGHDGDLQYENARAYAGRVYWPESARGHTASVTLNIYSTRTATDEDSSWFADGADREKVATLMIWSGEVCVVRVSLHSLVLLSVNACLFTPIRMRAVLSISDAFFHRPFVLNPIAPHYDSAGFVRRR